MPAPKGNQNARNAREWRDAIRYALARKGRESDPDGSDAAYVCGLRMVAEKFVDAACNGDAWALKELGDRWDGKPTQAMELGGPGGGDIPLNGTVRFISLNSD